MVTKIYNRIVRAMESERHFKAPGFGVFFSQTQLLKWCYSWWRKLFWSPRKCRNKAAEAWRVYMPDVKKLLIERGYEVEMTNIAGYHMIQVKHKLPQEDRV